MASFLDVVREARPFLTGSARERLLTAMAPFAEVCREVALECHLSDASARVDLVVRVRPPERDALLAAEGAVVATGARAFLEAWASDDDLAALPFVELEIDLDGERPRDPWVGPCIEPLIAHGIAAVTRSHRGLAAVEWPSFRLAIAVLRRLGGGDDAWRARLRALFEALPPGGCINHLTWLGARPSRAGSSAIRAIASLPSAHALGTLRSIGWRGDIEALAHLLRRRLPHATRVDLDLDVDLDGAAGDTACHVGFAAPRPRDAALARMLAALHAEGSVRTESLAAIEAWLAAIEPRVERALSLKLGLRADGTRPVKVYLEATRS